MRTARHGPTGAPVFGQTGTRPRNDVRQLRNPWCSTRLDRHRARGPRRVSIGASAAQRMTSLLPALRFPRGTSWRTNMLVECTRCRPSSHTSARVARPPSTSRCRPDPLAGTRQENHQSSASKSCSSPMANSPASRIAPAAVPGTLAGRHSRLPGRASGWVTAPGAVGAQNQDAPASRSPARRGRPDGWGRDGAGRRAHSAWSATVVTASPARRRRTGWPPRRPGGATPGASRDRCRGSRRARSHPRRAPR